MTDSRLLTPEKREDDTDLSLRPLSLVDFTGQKAARANLQVFINAAKSRGDALDHVLFVGPPGLGKTTLAQIVARELGVNFRSTSGPVIAKAGDLAAQLTNLEERDVLFIDEIHRLNPAVEEILYPAMEDYQLDLIIGEGPAARSVKIELPKFTLVGATTRAGLLTTPLRDRFGIPIRLEFYTVEELELIVRRGARVLGLGMSADGANEIARRARGTPRIAGRLLRRVRDFAIVDGVETVTREHADAALRLLDVDPIGLDQMDRKYLSLVALSFGGGPVGIETIAAALSEPRDAIEDIIEPYLLQKGFVQRTPRGRMLTTHAFRHLGWPSRSGRPRSSGSSRGMRMREKRGAHSLPLEGRARVGGVGSGPFEVVPHPHLARSSPQGGGERVSASPTSPAVSKAAPTSCPSASITRTRISPARVYHASYLRFLERGRTELLRAVEVAQSDLHAEMGGLAFVVRKMTIDFLGAALMDDIVTVVTRPKEMRGASMILAQEVRRGERRAGHRRRHRGGGAGGAGGAHSRTISRGAALGSDRVSA